MGVYSCNAFENLRWKTGSEKTWFETKFYGGEINWGNLEDRVKDQSQEKCSRVSQTKFEVPNGSEKISLEMYKILNKLPPNLTFNVIKVWN